MLGNTRIANKMVNKGRLLEVTSNLLSLLPVIAAYGVLLRYLNAHFYKATASCHIELGYGIQLSTRLNGDFKKIIIYLHAKKYKKCIIVCNGLF